MTAPRPPSRFRYSLSTLLLLTTIVAMGLVIWQLAPLREEVQRLRNQAGYLTVRDPSRVHAIAIDTDSPLVWKWKVLVPEGSRMVGLGMRVGKIPASGDLGALNPSVQMPQPESVEMEVWVRVFLDLDSKWKCESSMGGGSVVKEMSDAQLSALRDSGGSTFSGVGRSTVVEQPGKPLILMRRRFVPQSEAQGRGVDFRDHEKAGEGILIWLETRLPLEKGFLVG